MNRQQPFTGYPAATYFFRREKVGKKRFSPACVLAASEIARRQFRRRGLGRAKIPRLAGLRAFLSYRRAIFMGHSVYALSSGDGPA